MYGGNPEQYQKHFQQQQEMMEQQQKMMMEHQKDHMDMMSKHQLLPHQMMNHQIKMANQMSKGVQYWNPHLMTSLHPWNNPFMLGLYGSYHHGNVMHPLHPFNPMNSYAGMAFNPMMTGPYGFGGATYMDSFIDGEVTKNRLRV